MRRIAVYVWTGGSGYGELLREGYAGARARTTQRSACRNAKTVAIHSKGRRAWHKTSGYSRRSRVENVNCRYKATFGPGMRARSLAGQRLEARLGCRILNRMAQLGMPRSMVAE